MELTNRFSSKCYTPLELYCYTSVFKSLADSSSGIKYWSEPTLARFLALPDSLAVSSVVFQMASYLGAFPFPSQAPAILTCENLLKVVTLLTRRYSPVLGKKGDRVWIAEIYRSLAVYDRGLSAPSSPTTTRPAAGSDTGTSDKDAESTSDSYTGFAVDAPADDDGDEDDGDELVLAALDSMDVNEVFKQGENTKTQHSVIPTDNFLRLLQLLLFIAPLESQDDLALYGAQLTDERLKGLRDTAGNILSAFGLENSPGVNFKSFKAVISYSLPHIFDGLNPLFEHFLFAKDFDLSKRKDDPPKLPSQQAPQSPAEKDAPAPEPVLISTGEILDLNVLCQLSFMIKGNTLFRRLRPLYSGGNDGFSMGSFEKAVFNWRAPSILLVSGTLLPDTPSNSSERTFAESLPHSRLPSSLDLPSTKGSSDRDETLVFGAYIPVPWKSTPKTCFGDDSTLLFELGPTHDLFRASKSHSDYIYFDKPPHQPSGIGFGSGVPQAGASASHSRHSYGPIPLGAVSLHLDSALEFGVFTHLCEGGGSFQSSQNPSRRRKDWQDRFAIDSIEVWGCGGDDEADAQRKAWAFEEREAAARRKINLGTGDIEADRELLKMAGIIQENSGGSV